MAKILRRRDEGIYIEDGLGDRVEVYVDEIQGDDVYLSVRAPEDVRVLKIEQSGSKKNVEWDELSEEEKERWYWSYAKKC
jgi:sRNA-binding carbon storage regulator CsrA